MREISLHILDLVQNSIEADATEISLEIIEDTVNDKFVVCIKDNGRGMDKETCLKIRDPFVTSRRTRRVGLGLALTDMSTKNCDGYLTIDSEPKKGTTVLAVYKYSHIDRPPLGNIAETLKIILIANPNCLIRYYHKVDNNVFKFSSNEITNIIGEIPLTHPEVITWLSDFLSQNIADLYKLHGGKIK